MIKISKKRGDYDMLECLCVGVGGFIGSVCRYLIGLLPLETESGFPVKTFLINIAGAFFISLITVLATKNKPWNPNVVLLMKAGICGGFTTFSTFAFESVELIRNGNTWTAVVYMAGSIAMGAAAVAAAQLFS